MLAVDVEMFVMVADLMALMYYNKYNSVVIEEVLGNFGSVCDGDGAVVVAVVVRVVAAVVVVWWYRVMKVVMDVILAAQQYQMFLSEIV